MTEHFLVVAHHHWSEDDYNSNENINRSDNWQVSLSDTEWLFQVSCEALENENHNASWVNKLDQDTEVSLEWKHPPASGLVIIAQD